MEKIHLDEKEKGKNKELAATNKLLKVIRGENKSGEWDMDCPSPMITDEDEFEEKRQIEKEKNNQGLELSTARELKTEPPKLVSNNQHIHLPFSSPIPKQKKAGWLKWLKGKEKRAVGLDIGSHSIKYVLIEKTSNGINVLNYNIVELPSEYNKEEIDYAHILKSMLLGINFEGTRLVTSISGPSVIVRHIQFPPMNEHELAQSLNWEAKSYIPFPLNEVNVDYQLLPRKKFEQKLDVILVAVTKKMIRSHLDILQSAAIKPDIIDIDPLVLINTYMLTNQLEQEKPIALLYIGAKSSVLSLYRPDSLFFTRDIHIGGNTFTKQIQSQMKISYDQAESIKKGVIPEEFSSIKSQEWQKIFKPIISDIITEVKRSLIYYDNQTGKKGFGTLVLTGGGALLQGLSEVFSSELGLAINFFEPFKRLKIKEGIFSPLLNKNLGERLSLAIGLALRGAL